jgi:tetratricopeptide (TPR) repeat protein
MLQKYKKVIIIVSIVVTIATIFYLSMLILHNKMKKEYEKTAALYDLIINRQFEKALVECIKLKSIYPKDYNLYYQSGGIYYALGKYEKAIEEYNKTLELNPQFVQGYIDRASTYDNLQRYDKSVNDYGHAFTLTPDRSEYLFFIADSYEKAGKIDAAIEYYRKFLKTASSNSNDVMNLRKNIKIANEKIGQLKGR